MEIRIRTAEEITASHVTFEIKAADRDEALKISHLLLDRPDAAQTVRELAVTRTSREVIRAKAADLESELDKVRHDNQALFGQVEVLKRQVGEYDRDRTTERDRADRLQMERTELRRQLDECANNLGRAIASSNEAEAEAGRMEFEVAKLSKELVDIRQARQYAIARAEKAEIDASEAAGLRKMRDRLEAAVSAKDDDVRELTDKLARVAQAVWVDLVPGGTNSTSRAIDTVREIVGEPEA